MEGGSPRKNKVTLLRPKKRDSYLKHTNNKYVATVRWLTYSPLTPRYLLPKNGDFVVGLKVEQKRIGRIPSSVGRRHQLQRDHRAQPMTCCRRSIF